MEYSNSFVFLPILARFIMGTKLAPGLQHRQNEKVPQGGEPAGQGDGIMQFVPTGSTCLLAFSYVCPITSP